MKKESINPKVFQINTSSLSKTQKSIHNKIYQKYRLRETYKLLKFIYKNKVDFSDIFMEDLFNILIETNKYTSKIMSVYYYTFFPENDDMSQIKAITLNSAACIILKAIILNKPVLSRYKLEKLMFASLIIFLDKSFYYCRFKYPSKLNKYIEDESIDEYVNAINSKNDNFEFIWNLIEAELKNEALIFKNNHKLYRLLNGEN